MGLKLSDVRREERTATIDFGYGELTVTYRPNVYTPAMVSEMAAVDTDSDNAAIRSQNQSFIRQMTELLVSWDLIDDDGEVVPIDATDDAFLSVPFPIFRAVMVHIGEDNRPGKARSSSGAG